jgi:hypothetical protein
MTISRLISRWGLLVVFLVVFGAFSAWLPNRFPTSGNVQDILTSQPPGIFIAYAAMVVLVVGEFDLSIGATLGMSQYIVLKLITHYGLSWEAAILAALGIGAAIGAANAIAVVGLGINSFIATIGVATILEGLVQWISSGNEPIFGGAPHGLTTLAQTKHVVVLPVYYALVVSVLLWVVLEFTVFGRQMRATGAPASGLRCRLPRRDGGPPGLLQRLGDADRHLPRRDRDHRAPVEGGGVVGHTRLQRRRPAARRRRLDVRGDPRRPRSCTQRRSSQEADAGPGPAATGGRVSTT